MGVPWRLPLPLCRCRSLRSLQKRQMGQGQPPRLIGEYGHFARGSKAPIFAPKRPQTCKPLHPPLHYPPFWLLPTLCLLCPLWAYPPAFLYGAFSFALWALFGSGFHACPPCHLLPSLPLWRSANKPCFLDLALGYALGLSVFCSRLSTALGVSGWLWLWDSPFYALSGSLPFGVSGRFWLWDSPFYALSGSDLPCLWLWAALGIAKPHRRFFVSVGLMGFA